MHNHNSNHDSKMMWWMMIGCVLPVILLLLFGGKSGGFSWLIVLAVVFMFGMHLFSMRHGKNEDASQSSSPEPKPSEGDHSGHNH